MSATLEATQKQLAEESLDLMFTLLDGVIGALESDTYEEESLIDSLSLLTEAHTQVKIVIRTLLLDDPALDQTINGFEARLLNALQAPAVETLAAELRVWRDQGIPAFRGALAGA